MRQLVLSVCCGVILSFISTCIAGDFPYREKYPDVNVVELTDLKSGYDRKDFIIVDIRSKLEFDTIHIKNAQNVPYGNANFSQKLDKIARQHPGRKVALYDNGVECIKSYLAAEDAYNFVLIPDVFAFDAGIDAWAKAYPSDTLFLGKELKDPGQQFISEELYVSKKLPIETFRKNAGNGNAVVIDLRDPIQRKEKLPGFDNALTIPVDKLVKNIISKGRFKDKQLFIFDQVGRQTRWVMYYLVDNGYTDYFFLSGGATSVLKNQEYRVSFVQ